MQKPIKETYVKDSMVPDWREILEYEEFANEHWRKEKFKNHFSYILISFLYGASTIIGCMIICWSWHFLFPETWYFLSNDRIHEIQNMLFAGLVSQAIPYISSYLKKQG